MKIIIPISAAALCAAACGQAPTPGNAVASAVENSASVAPAPTQDLAEGAAASIQGQQSAIDVFENVETYQSVQWAHTTLLLLRLDGMRYAVRIEKLATEGDLGCSISATGTRQGATHHEASGIDLGGTIVATTTEKETGAAQIVRVRFEDDNTKLVVDSEIGDTCGQAGDIDGAYE